MNAKSLKLVIFKAQNAPKQTSCGAPLRTPLRVLAALPQTHRWWGLGSLHPPQEHHLLLSALRALLETPVNSNHINH